jgi:8-oxo-dGTP diphosphatase
MVLLVVRHAPAGRRASYDGDDRLRPLSARGRARANDLVPVLVPFRPKRILSSPFVRCFQTVRPLAEELDVPVESIDELAEGNGQAAVSLLRRMAGESAVLCTHGDVETEMLEFLVPDGSKSSRSSLKLQKGEVWVLESAGSTLTIVERISRSAVGGRSS